MCINLKFLHTIESLTSLLNEREPPGPSVGLMVGHSVGHSVCYNFIKEEGQLRFKCFYWRTCSFTCLTYIIDSYNYDVKYNEQRDLQSLPLSASVC